MARSIWMFWLATGCDAEEEPLLPAAECAADLTWTSFAGPLVITWCQPCHSSGLSGEARQGAPEELNFDTPAEVLAVADRVLARATGPAADMPPGGGPTDQDREQFAEWLACGTATATTPTPWVDPCLPRVEVPGDARSSTWDCSAGNVVAGDLAVDGPSSCICEVTGQVTVEADAELAGLQSVGGDLVVSGAATSVSLPWLTSVGGSVLVVDNPTLQELNAVRLETIGADLSFENNDAFVSLTLLGSLTSVRDVVIRGNASLGAVDGLARVASVRSLTVEDNASLQTLRSFLFVTEMDGALVFDGNPQLGAIQVTPDLTRAGAIQLRNNAALTQIASFVFLTDIDGDLEFSNLSNLRLLGNGAPRGGPWQALEHVGGNLTLTDNGALATAEALHGLSAVDGGLTVTNNPKLGQAEVDALVGAIDHVGGAIVTAGNGP